MATVYNFHIMEEEKESINMRKMTKNNKGFSLVELIVVIAIMAVLMAVLVPTLVKNVEKSRLQSDKSALAELRQAVVTVVADDKYVGCKGSGAQGVASSKVNVAGLFDTTDTTVQGAALVTELEEIIGTDIKLKSKLADADTSATVQIYMDARNGLVVLDVVTKDTKDSFHITSSGEHSGKAADCADCKDKAPVKK
jgi:type IV pilus assembly protein PilA